MNGMTQILLDNNSQSCKQISHVSTKFSWLWTTRCINSRTPAVPFENRHSGRKPGHWQHKMNYTSQH